MNATSPRPDVAAVSTHRVTVALPTGNKGQLAGSGGLLRDEDVPIIF